MCFGLTEEDNDDSLCAGIASYNWRDHCRNSNEKKVASSLPPPFSCTNVDITMLSLTLSSMMLSSTARVWVDG